MSERSIMIAVVVALLGAAFFFPYESDDDYYAKHQKKAPPKTVANSQQDVNPREVESKGSTNDARLAVEVPGGGRADSDDGSPSHKGGAGDPGAAAPLADQVRAAQKEIEKKNGGFADGERLQGAWVEVFDAPAATAVASLGGHGGAIVQASTQPSLTTPENPATITFHEDGTFTEHMLLTMDGEAISAARPDFVGHYALQGFVMSIIRTDDAAREELTGTRKLDYVICPLGVANADGQPTRIFVDGKVLRYKGK